MIKKREERVRARKKEVARIREKMTIMRKAIQLAEIPAGIQVGKVFQDLFGFLRMEDDDKIREWLKEPWRMKIRLLLAVEDSASDRVCSLPFI